MRDELDQPQPTGDPDTVALTRCSSCGYDLTGPSLGETCPECGRRLVLRAWFPLHGRVVWQRALAVCLVTTMAVLCHYLSRGIFVASLWWTIAAFVAILALLIVAVIALVTRLSRPPKKHDVEIIVSVHGFTAQPRRGRPIHAPWRSLGSVEMNRNLGGLRLLTLRRRPSKWLPPSPVSFVIDAAQVDAEALRKRIERLIAESSSPGGPHAEPRAGLDRPMRRTLRCLA